jgi:predicted nucleic acid-binding protein
MTEKMIEIYIDSNVIVASEIEEEEEHQKSEEFMEYVLASKGTDTIFFTSVFTFSELASAMIRRTNNKDKAYSLLYQIRNSWKKFIKPLPPIPGKKRADFIELVETLIESAIRFRTPSADTIHAQTVAGYEINYLVTWNKKDFSEMEKQINGLKVLTPTEMLEELRKI